MPATQAINQPKELAIFARLLSNGKEEFTPELARYVLSLGFNDLEKTRIGDLAARNQEGKLSTAEKDELLAYANAGCLLGILKSKVRKTLR